MVVLGLILILLALAVGGYTVMGGLPSQEGTDVTLSFLGLVVQTSAVVVFALGALTLLLLELGVLAMRSGAQRLRRVEAEIQSRQSAEAQRNATAASAPATAPAPFARRDTAGDTGSTETVRTDRPDPSTDYRPSTEHRPSTGSSPDAPRDDASDVRPTQTGSHPTAGSTGTTGAGVDRDPSDGTSRTDRP